MTQDGQDATVERAYREYRRAKHALAELEISCVEISTTSSITSKDGYLMYSPSDSRLLSTDYVKEQVALYRAAEQKKEELRQHLIDLGEPDPG
jgi:hypothetical protein